MIDDKKDARWPTLVAGLILLIVLAAVAAMSAGLDGEIHEFAVPESSRIHVELSDHMEHIGAVASSDVIQGSAFTRLISGARTPSPVSGRISPSLDDSALGRLLESLEPIGAPMSACLADDALVTYDLGIAPGTAIDLVGDLLESAVPEIHERLRAILHEFHLATGLDPKVDLLPHLGHGMAAGLLPPEADPDGWPLPRKVVIMRVLDDEAVARYLEAWIEWVAGAVAPMTHGVLGASIDSEDVAGSDLVGLRLDGPLPAQLPMPSPSYVVADGLLIVSPVRSAVAETVHRLGEGCTSTPAGTADQSAVEKVWLNLPQWPRAWRRAEPLVGSILGWLGADSDDALRACTSLFRLLGEFKPAHGTTTLTPNGGFVFRIEFELAEVSDSH